MVYTKVSDDDVRSIIWLSGTDEDWIENWGIIPMPYDLIQKYEDGNLKIWSTEYPEEGYLEIHPPKMINELVVKHVELHRDPTMFDNAWMFKITL